MQQLLAIGFGNAVVKDKVIAILNPKSSPIVKFREEAKRAGRLIDVTHGRRTRSIVATDRYIILSAISFQTLLERFHQTERHSDG